MKREPAWGEDNYASLLILLLIQNGLKCQIKKWFYNNTHAIRKEAGEVKQKRKSQPISDPTSTDDEAALQSHCKEIQKESQKKKRDYPKLFRLLQLTSAYRRQWMTEMNSPIRVATNIHHYPCLKLPLLVM